MSTNLLSKFKIFLAIESAKNPWRIDQQESEQVLKGLQTLADKGEIVIDPATKALVKLLEEKIASTKNKRRPCFI